MMRHSPFRRVDGHTYLDVAFTLPGAGKLPSLPEMLAQLLRHYRPNDLTLLRPLSRAKHRLLEQAREGVDVETWASVVAKDEDRYRPRIGRRQKKR